jgi:hypothetical protein
MRPPPPTGLYIWSEQRDSLRTPYIGPSAGWGRPLGAVESRGTGLRILPRSAAFEGGSDGGPDGLSTGGRGARTPGGGRRHLPNQRSETPVLYHPLHMQFTIT